MTGTGNGDRRPATAGARRSAAALLAVLGVGLLASACGGTGGHVALPSSTSVSSGVPSSGPTTGVPAPAVPAAVLMSSTAPSGAVPISPNQDAQRIVSVNPPGSAFVIEPGVHVGWSVEPQSGDTFYGQAGAVLNGENVVQTAFATPAGITADDVAIVGQSQQQPLVIENYGVSHHSQIAAIQPLSRSGNELDSGWHVQWVEVTGDASRGVSVSDSMVIVGCTVVDNDRLGIGGSGDHVTIEQDVVSDNGNAVGDRGWEAGGIKVVASNVLVADDQISSNGAPGVWTDGGASDILVTGDSLQSNLFGVRVEISTDVAITDDAISDSGQQAVLVVASDHVRVDDNDVTDNHEGILVGGVTRVGTGGVRLGDVLVSANTVVDSGTSGIHQPLLPGMVVRFSGNHYSGERLQWEGKGVSFARWQLLGQDQSGTAQD